MLLHLYYFLSVLVSVREALTVSRENIPTVVLETNKHYCNQKLLNGKSVHYHLTKLQSNTGYELRISYPAVIIDHERDLSMDKIRTELGPWARSAFVHEIPTLFVLKDVNKTSNAGRKLLNVEKLTFWTEFNEKEKHIQVTAFRIGIPVKPSLTDLPVTYDIKLDRLYGGLPWNVWKVAVIVILTIFIVIKYCLQRAIYWINGEADKLE